MIERNVTQNLAGLQEVYRNQEVSSMNAAIKIEAGVYDIHIDEYHSGPGISRSGIMEFRKSPRHYWHKYINPDYSRKATSDAQTFGSAFHCYVLEPEKFKKEYFIAENNPFHGNSKEGRAHKAQMQLMSAGKIVLDKEDLDLIIKMNESLKSDYQAIELIKGAQYEKSIFWIDPDTELLCKVRPDIMHDDFIVDLKTTSDASYREFQRSFYNYGYHLQLAMMHEALKHTQNKIMYNFIDLAIEKTEPFCHGIYSVDEEAINQGVSEFKYYLSEIKKCVDTNIWPSYKTQTLSLPGYAKFEGVQQ